MYENRYITWAMQTSKRWNDISDILKVTGIDFIDNDHKILVEYSLELNKVLDKSEREFTLDLINETKILLDDIFLYTKEHFKKEENFMKVYDLPGYDDHIIEHDNILNMLDDVIENFNVGKINITRYLKVQIMDWLVKHINDTDYKTFKIDNWSKNILEASDWKDIKEIIRLVGIQDIDEQHQIMTIKTLDLMNIIKQNRSNSTIEAKFKEILEYAKFHFSYEENFMKTYNINDIAKHKIDHDFFIEKINHYAVEIIHNKSVFDAMKSWILNWWINHINVVDCNYFAYHNWGYQLLEKVKNVNEIIVILRKTGIEEVDSDHVNLMELTLKLNNMIDNVSNLQEEQKDVFRTNVVQLFEEIIKFANNHFKSEESIMEKNYIEGYRNHKAEHNNILNKMSSLLENYQNGRLFLSANLKTTLLEWWINHTNTTDFRTFVQNYNGQGH